MTKQELGLGSKSGSFQNRLAAITLKWYSCVVLWRYHGVANLKRARHYLSLFPIFKSTINNLNSSIVSLSCGYSPCLSIPSKHAIPSMNLSLMASRLFFLFNGEPENSRVKNPLLSSEVPNWDTATLEEPLVYQNGLCGKSAPNQRAIAGVLPSLERHSALPLGLFGALQP
jgi:hypothetical protein